jgi:hypothetical protein
MKKLAVFVEGYTELIFLEALIEQIAGANSVLIEQRRLRGGTNTRRRMALVKAAKANTGQKYFVLLVDCGGDDLVKARIVEEHQNLTRHHYTKIIGIRDVRPTFNYADIPKLEAGLPKYVKTGLIPVEFILSIMEIEAWFLAEFNHFPKIHLSITVPAIKATLGFDPENDDMALRPTPATDLNACYAIGGKAYGKSTSAITVAALDYSYLYLELRNKIGYLQRLVDGIDGFLA